MTNTDSQQKTTAEKLALLILRLDNGTQIGCCPSLGVKDGNQAAVRLFREGCEAGSVTAIDLDQLSHIVGVLDAQVAARDRKRKSDALSLVRPSRDGNKLQHAISTLFAPQERYAASAGRLVTLARQ
jgi:hypothetical protein